VTSLAFASDGTLYAVELATDGLLTGSAGALVRITPGASGHTVVAADLDAPYGVAIRGGYAYVTVGSVSTDGSVLMIRL